MACHSITLTDIERGCKNSMGGIKDIWIIEADSIASTGVTVDESTEMITEITTIGSAEFSHWQFRDNTANATSNMTIDDAAGTSYCQTDLALQFSQQEHLKRLQIKAATVGDTKVIYRDNNNRLWFMGYNHPVVSTNTSGATGTAMGDFNGYNITLTDYSNDLPMEVEKDAEMLAEIGITL